MSLFQVIQPELILVIVACALFIVGVIDRPIARKAAAAIAVAALVFVFGWTVFEGISDASAIVQSDPSGAFRVGSFAQYIKMLSAGVGVMLALLAWPSDRLATGNSALNFGTEGGEFFALLLLSISGIFVVAGANDIILLFLGIELASIPTYIMVSVSRPLPQAQEAGVKYFFLGAMAAALMLFGFSYLYGTAGTTSLTKMTLGFNAVARNSASGLVTLTPWQTMAVVMLIAGFAFKMAAVPMHFYAADVYQGAATPVTALLSYVPKTSGLVALLKILFMIGGAVWAVPVPIGKLIWILAVLTMTVGNVLGLLQQNVKRVLAYSSIAHSGYLLVGVATIATGQGSADAPSIALRAVLFYLTAYGLMNTAAFGVLMMLPAKPPPPWERDRARFSTGSAETFDDLAGAGIERPGLGLAIAVACFSLIGIPLTVGFAGKFQLIQAAWRGQNTWLVVIMMINAAISAGYYLRIVATMFLRPEPIGGIEVEPSRQAEVAPIPRSIPVLVSIGISVVATLLLGAVMPAIDTLNSQLKAAAVIDTPSLGMPQASASSAQPREGPEQVTAAGFSFHKSPSP
jgi:NADH-quinone oxidoreductase subunit N